MVPDSEVGHLIEKIKKVIYNLKFSNLFKILLEYGKR